MFTSSVSNATASKRSLNGTSGSASISPNNAAAHPAIDESSPDAVTSRN